MIQLLCWLPLAASLTILGLPLALREQILEFHHIQTIVVAFSAAVAIFIYPVGWKKKVLLLCSSCYVLDSAVTHLPYYYHQKTQGPFVGKQYNALFVTYDDPSRSYWIDSVVKERRIDLLIVVQEGQKKTLQIPTLPIFPYVITVEGLTLYSRFPVHSDSSDLGPDVPKVIEAAVNLPEIQPLQIVVCSFPSPQNQINWNQGWMMGRRLATPIRHSDQPWLIALQGHAGPSGKIITSFLKAARLHDLQLGFGFHTTTKKGIFSTKSDYLLGNRQIQVSSSETLEVPESDHRALFSSFFISSQNSSSS